MKRLIAILLAGILTLGLCACADNAATPSTAPTETGVDSNFSVPAPMAVPVYAQDTSANSDQLRQTAVQAMRDLLSTHLNRIVIQRLFLQRI